MRSRHSAILRLRSRRRTFGRAPAVAELIDSDGQVTKLIVTELKNITKYITASCILSLPSFAHPQSWYFSETYKNSSVKPLNLL